MTHAIQIHDRKAQERDAFIDRMLQSVAGAFDVFSIYLGDRLGFYRCLVEHGPLTPGGLAARAPTCERYAREWRGRQTGGRILPGGGAGRRGGGAQVRAPG